MTAGSGNVYIGGGTQQADEISPEELVPGWVHAALFAVGAASAVILAGPVVAGVALAGGLAGGEIGGWAGGNLFGEGSDGQKWSMLAGSLVGGGYGAKGGVRIQNIPRVQAAYANAGSKLKGLSTKVPNTTLPEGIFADSRGVYGYLPKPGSRYASDLYDFSDPVFVARNRQIRLDYLDGSDVLESAIGTMRVRGAPAEKIAHRVVWQRNSQKLEARSLMTEQEVGVLEAGNLKRYGDPVGPTPQQLFQKYGDWEVVIQKSMEKDPAINMLLGISKHR